MKTASPSPWNYSGDPSPLPHRIEREERLNWSFDPHTFLAMFRSRSSNAYFGALWYGVSNQAAFGGITEKERGGQRTS